MWDLKRRCITKQVRVKPVHVRGFLWGGIHTQNKHFTLVKYKRWGEFPGGKSKSISRGIVKSGMVSVATRILRVVVSTEELTFEAGHVEEGEKGLLKTSGGKIRSVNKEETGKERTSSEVGPKEKEA